MAIACAYFAIADLRVATHPFILLFDLSSALAEVGLNHKEREP